MKYDNEELEILEAIERDDIRSVDFDNDAIKKHAQNTLKYIKQKNRKLLT